MFTDLGPVLEVERALIVADNYFWSAYLRFEALSSSFLETAENNPFLIFIQLFYEQIL